MKPFINEAVQTRIQVIDKFSAVRNYVPAWTDSAGNLKRNTFRAELWFLIAFVLFFIIMFVPKVFFLLKVGPFWNAFAKVSNIDLFTALFLLFYFSILEFRVLWTHRCFLKNVQYISTSNTTIHVWNEHLLKLSKFKWIYLPILLVLLILMTYSQVFNKNFDNFP